MLQQEREFHTSVDSKILVAKGQHGGGNSSGSQNFSHGSKNFSQNSSGKSVNDKHCTYCNKPRHTEDTCYRKHSFPPGFKFRSSGSSSIVNQVSAQDSGSAQSVHASHSSTASVLPQLSSTQYQRLLALLDSSSSTPLVNHLSTSAASVTGFCSSISSQNFVSWIIDSGATDLVCCSLDLFSSYNPIAPISVRLPTGSHVIASHSGTVILSSALTLTNILFIPNFFNIFSVSRLQPFPMVLSHSILCFVRFTYSVLCG